MIINNSLQYKYSEDHLTRSRFKGSGREKESVADHSGVNNAAPECDKINLNTSVNKTTAGANPSGRLSFKGREVVITKTAEELKKTFAGKLAMNKGFNWFLDSIANNTLVAEALFALGLTTILRPAAIYAIPARNEEEKKKNKYQVAHSVATGLLGLGLTFAVAEPLKRGVKKIIKNPNKYLTKNGNYLNPKNERLFKETATRLHQPFFLPIRAMLTIMMISPLLKTIFGIEKNPQKNVTPEEKAKIDYALMNFKGDDKKAFQNFAGMTGATVALKTAAEAAKGNNAKAVPSFKGIKPGAAVTDGIATGVGKIVDTKGFRGFMEWLGKKEKWFPHLIAAESLWLSAFYMQQTAASKKIEKDQKPAMILNQGITALLCTAGAYVIDGKVNKMLEKFKAVYKKVNPGLEQKVLDRKMTAIKLLGPIVIFTTIYRFIGPVLITPVANWISEKIPTKKDKQSAQKA